MSKDLIKQVEPLIAEGVIKRYPIYAVGLRGRSDHVLLGEVLGSTFKDAVETWLWRQGVRDGRRPRNISYRGEFTKGQYKSLRYRGEHLSMLGAAGRVVFYQHPAWPVWIREGRYVEQNPTMRRILMSVSKSDLSFHPTKFLGQFHAPTQEEAFDVARYEMGLGRDVVFSSTQKD